MVLIKPFMACLWIIHAAKRILIFCGQEYVKIYLKSTKSTKFSVCLKSVTSVKCEVV